MPSGGVVVVGSCAVLVVLPADGSFALVLGRPGALAVEIGRETPISSAALAHSRPLGARVLVMAGHMVVHLVLSGVGLSVIPIGTV